MALNPWEPLLRHHEKLLRCSLQHRRRSGVARYGPTRPRPRRPTLSRPSRILRVAPLPIRADRVRELRRILGDGVEISETRLTGADGVAARSVDRRRRRRARRRCAVRPSFAHRRPRLLHAASAAVGARPHDPGGATTGLRRVRRRHGPRHAEKTPRRGACDLRGVTNSGRRHERRVGAG